MQINEKLRQDMLILLGQINSLCFPLMWVSENEHLNQAYYDLIESIKSQYEGILRALIGYEG